MYYRIMIAMTVVFLPIFNGFVQAQSIDTINALVIFVKFSDDFYDNYLTPGWPFVWDDTLPSWADSVIDSTEASIRNMTITGFYDEMSYGNLKVFGHVYNSLYVPDSLQDFYKKSDGVGYDSLNKKICEDLDPYIDYSKYDSDGDNIVDMVFMCYRLYKRTQFLGTDAVGISAFGKSYVTDDGVTISRGTTQYTPGLPWVVGVTTHELGHNLNNFGLTWLDDYYDEDSYRTCDGDWSAGLGGFAVMAGGMGINEPYDSAPMCVYNRVEEGWITSSDIINITGWKRDYEVHYIGNRTYGKGKIIRLERNSNEFFWVVNKQNYGAFDESFKNDGLLIYHVDESKANNGWELHKKIDVECADGLWDTTGWDPNDLPLAANPINGRDNLDYFEGNDTVANNLYNGNRGDSTDFFDGIIYTCFSEMTNPNSCWYGSGADYYKQNVSSHVAVLNIRRKAGADSVMIADFYTNNWTGHISSNTTWSDSVHISGDIIIDIGATLTISAGTKIIIEPSYDDQDTGVSSSKIEFIVNGDLIAESSSDTILFTSCASTPGTRDWYGIRNYGYVSLKRCRVEYADYPVRVYSTADSTRIENSALENYYYHGVNVSSGGPLFVKNCRIGKTSSGSARGISMSSSITSAEIDGNTINELTGTSTLYGIYVSSTVDNADVKITNNTITNIDNGSTRRGMYLRGDYTLASHNLIKDFNGTSGYAFYVSGASNDTLRGNVVYNDRGSFSRGIYTSSCSNISIEHDTVADCATRGVELYNTTGDLLDNVIEDNLMYAYAIYGNGSGTDAYIEDNHVRAFNRDTSCYIGVAAVGFADLQLRESTIEDYWIAGVASGGTDGVVDCGTSGDNESVTNFV